MDFLENEANETINSILKSYENEEELTDTIPALGKDWIDISWDVSNRIPKPNQPRQLHQFRQAKRQNV